MLGKGTGGANKFFRTLVPISLPGEGGGQDRWFCMQVGGKGWKVVVNFGVFPPRFVFSFLCGGEFPGRAAQKD